MRDEHGVRKFRTVRRQPETARWRLENVDAFNPKPQRTMAAGGVEPLLDPQMGHATTIDQNLQPEKASEEKAQEAAGQRRWYVTEVSVREHGRTMGCGSGLGMHDAECPRRVEGRLLQQSRMKPEDDPQAQAAATTTPTLVPMDEDNPTEQQNSTTATVLPWGH